MSPRFEILQSLVILKRVLGRRHPDVIDLQHSLASLRAIYIISRAMHRAVEESSRRSSTETIH